MLSKAVIIGNLGRDPESKAYGDGNQLTSFSVAINKKVKGEKQTAWVNVTVFGKQAEWVAKDARKGSKVYVEGELFMRTYQGKDGTEKTACEVTVGAYGGTCIVLDKAGADGNTQPSRPSASSSFADEMSDDVPF